MLEEADEFNRRNEEREKKEISDMCKGFHKELRDVGFYHTYPDLENVGGWERCFSGISIGHLEQ